MNTMYFLEDCSTLPGVDLPHWAMRRLFQCIRLPKNVDLSDPSKLTCHITPRLTGHEIIDQYVGSYSRESLELMVGPEDLIHGTFGLAEITLFSGRWRDMPWDFTNFSYGKRLLALRDVVIDEDGAVNIPFLNCHGISPSVDWFFATDAVDHNSWMYRLA